MTVRLGPSGGQRGAHQVRRVQVSAMLRPPNEDDPGGDSGGQSRFSALRQFAIHICLATDTVDCSDAENFELVLTSPTDAFPAVAPRPRAPELILRSFEIPRTTATHVRLEVLENQCTGTPAYRGDLDDDPRHNTDCVDGSPQDDNVRAAELQVFGR